MLQTSYFAPSRHLKRVLRVFVYLDVLKCLKIDFVHPMNKETGKILSVKVSDSQGKNHYLAYKADYMLEKSMIFGIDHIGLHLMTIL